MHQHTALHTLLVTGSCTYGTVMDEYVDKGNVALAMTRNPSRMTAKEVLSVRFACGTEDKEVDPTYEVVSLEANKGGHEGTTSAAGGGQKATTYDAHVHTNRW